MSTAGVHSIKALPIKLVPPTSLRCAMHLELLPASSTIISRVHLPCRKWRTGKSYVSNSGSWMWTHWGWHSFWKVKPVWDRFLCPQYYSMVQDILQKLVALEWVKKLIVCYSLAKGILVCSQMYWPFFFHRYGNEDKLVTIFGVMQALVSFVQANQDTIRSIHAGNSKFVFLIKGPIILVSVSRTTESVSQLVLQLT
jgi:hypothetical protein